MSGILTIDAILKSASDQDSVLCLRGKFCSRGHSPEHAHSLLFYFLYPIGGKQSTNELMYTQSAKALFLDMRCLFFNMADELVASASSKKKAYQRRRIMSSSEEENYQNGRARAKSDSENLGSAAMDDGVNDFENESIARKHSQAYSGKRKRRVMIPSDDEEDERLVKSRVLNLNYRRSWLKKWS